MRGWIGISLRAPRLTIVVIAAVTVVLGVFAAHIRVDSAIENLLPSDDPDRRYYETVRAVFGSEEATVIGLFGDVFTPETLATIDRLSRRLAELDGVREVISLTTVKGAETDELGVRIGPLMRALPRTAEEAVGPEGQVHARPAVRRQPGGGRRAGDRDPRALRAAVRRRVSRPRPRGAGAPRSSPRRAAGSASRSPACRR